MATQPGPPLSRRVFEFCGFIAIFACAVIAVLIFAGQALFWLRWGEWPDLKVQDAFFYYNWPFPNFTWGGIEKIALWFLDLPLSLGTFLFGLAVGGLSFVIAHDRR